MRKGPARAAKARGEVVGGSGLDENSNRTPKKSAPRAKRTEAKSKEPAKKVDVSKPTPTEVSLRVEAVEEKSVKRIGLRSKKVVNDENAKKPATTEKKKANPNESPVKNVAIAPGVKRTPLADRPLFKNKKSPAQNVYKDDVKVKKPATPLSKRKTNSKESPVKNIPITPAVKRTPLSDRAPLKNKKSPAENVYKNKLIILDDSQMNLSKSEMYEFKCDPAERVKRIKKKSSKESNKNDKTKPKKPAVRKKKLTDVAAERAMRKMLADLERIRTAKLFKKLQMLKKSKANGQAVEDAPPEVSELPACENDAPPSPSDYHHDDDNHDNDDPPENSDPFEDASNAELSLRPVANSTIGNLKDRPSGSPWRVNVDREPKKWKYNFYVKPSMTPAYERDTFHVLGLDDPVPAHPEIPAKSTPMKPVATRKKPSQESSEEPKQTVQTSLISFFRESLSKSPRKRAKPVAVQRESYDFDEISPIKSATPEKARESPPKKRASPTMANCFGFDEDLENVSPAKKKQVLSLQKRGLLKPTKPAATRARRVLGELGVAPKRPMRVTARDVQKAKVQKDGQRIRATTEDVPVERAVERANVDYTANDSDESSAENEDTETTAEATSQESSVEKSVALFEDPCEEDVNVAHYDKPSRKMYERKKKPHVRFKDLESVEIDHSDRESSDSEERAKRAKATKKANKKLKAQKTASKKIDKEFDQWAASFNSMLEEAEEFDLAVE